MYEVDDGQLLMVASDRISAFDCVLPQPIPHKGAVLTQISRYWFHATADIVHGHCLSADPDRIVRAESRAPRRADRVGRSRHAGRARPSPSRWSAWCGATWPARAGRSTASTAPWRASRCPRGSWRPRSSTRPRFSPATKAESGHDENITFDADAGASSARTWPSILREFSLDLYRFAGRAARERGIIIADTKFEFGTSLRSGEVLLIDEALTPDSSRFWPAETLEPGRTPPSLDKQPVRDYLQGLVDAGRWDKQPAGP